MSQADPRHPPRPRPRPRSGAKPGIDAVTGRDKAVALLEAKKTGRIKPGSEGLDYVAYFRATPFDRIATVKAGLPATNVKTFVSSLNMPVGGFFEALQLSPATFNRKVTNKQALTTDESERVMGFARLFGQVQVMIDQSGDAEGFDARAWTTRWLHEPLPALGGARPVEMLDTIEGQQVVSNALAQIQSGAYA